MKDRGRRSPGRGTEWNGRFTGPTGGGEEGRKSNAGKESRGAGDEVVAWQEP